MLVAPIFSIKISIYFFQRNIESVFWYLTDYLNKIIQCQKHGKVIILLSTISNKVICKFCVRVSNFKPIGMFFMDVSKQCFCRSFSRHNFSEKSSQLRLMYHEFYVQVKSVHI